MLLTTAKVQVLRRLEFSLYLWRKWPYEAGFHNVSIHMLDSLCLSSRPSLHFFTLLWVSRNLPWLSYPLAPREALAGDWREEGDSDQLPSALSPLTGSVPLLQVSSSCQMALSTQHSLSLGSGDHSFLSLRGGNTCCTIASTNSLRFLYTLPTPLQIDPL